MILILVLTLPPGNMFDWLKRLFGKEYISNESESESKYESAKEAQRKSPKGKRMDHDEKARKKHAQEHSRRQRARERQLTRDYNTEDRRWSVKRGGAAFAGMA